MLGLLTVTNLSLGKLREATTVVHSFKETKASLNGVSIRVSCTLNMLMWRYINKER